MPNDLPLLMPDELHPLMPVEWQPLLPVGLCPRSWARPILFRGRRAANARRPTCCACPEEIMRKFPTCCCEAPCCKAEAVVLKVSAVVLHMHGRSYAAGAVLHQLPGGRHAEEGNVENASSC